MQTAPAFAPDAREEQALVYLRPALDQAVRSRRPASVHWVPTSLDNSELVNLAVSLCRAVQANVAVLGNREARGLTFAPLM